VTAWSIDGLWKIEIKWNVLLLMLMFIRVELFKVKYKQRVLELATVHVIG
jgi:hypothetical protein